jgi:hypothetical protein
MGGTPVFRGTRVPVQTLIEYLERDENIDQFLQGFPSVTREQVGSPCSAMPSLSRCSERVPLSNYTENFAVNYSDPN